MLVEGVGEGIDGGHLTLDLEDFQIPTLTGDVHRSRGTSVAADVPDSEQRPSSSPGGFDLWERGLLGKGQYQRDPRLDQICSEHLPDNLHLIGIALLEELGHLQEIHQELVGDSMDPFHLCNTGGNLTWRSTWTPYR